MVFADFGKPTWLSSLVHKAFLVENSDENMKQQNCFPCACGCKSCTSPQKLDPTKSFDPGLSNGAFVIHGSHLQPEVRQSQVGVPSTTDLK